MRNWILVFLILLDFGLCTDVDGFSSANDFKVVILDVKEEAMLREKVYGDLFTLRPKTGRWAFFEILVVPIDLIPLQGAKLEPALMVLLDVVKGGRPKDAVQAAGLAFSLADDPVQGCLVSYMALKKFDAFDKLNMMTPRQKLAKDVQKLLDAKRKRSK